MSEGPATVCGPVALTFMFLIVSGIRQRACLQCYRCPVTEGDDVQSANVDCLVNGTETQCLPYHDRCHSYVEGVGSAVVQKGCTTAENCIGNRICCQTDFCNVGYGADLKTGFGQPCEGEASCVQTDGMSCRRETTDAGQLSRCLCADGWFSLGAACLPLVGTESRAGGVCYQDSHCRLENSFCQSQRCRCGDFFFPNHTGDLCQLRTDTVHIRTNGRWTILVAFVAFTIASYI